MDYSLLLVFFKRPDNNIEENKSDSFNTDSDKS